MVGCFLLLRIKKNGKKVKRKIKKQRGRHGHRESSLIYKDAFIPLKGVYSPEALTESCQPAPDHILLVAVRIRFLFPAFSRSS